MILVDEKELKDMGISSPVVKKIKAVSPIVPSPTKDMSKEILVSNTKATRELATAITKLSSIKPSDPVDLSPVIDSIQNIYESQLTVLQLLEQKIKPVKKKTYEFTVSRNKSGLIHKITANEFSK